ncbi:hypothetical protein HZC08_00100, partial [Candidatus Micrarchaeota archaeon]|nr:hypothetical protein [Candidatus Micrarchaeota archaeon]
PELKTTREELPETQKPLFDTLDNQLGKLESERLTLMKEFLVESQQKGHDTALLEFYIDQFEQSIDAGKDQIAHKDFVGAVGGVEQSEKYFDFYMGEAKELYESDSSGKTYVAPKNPLKR